MNKIKFCIWDVGQVIYEYSLDPLHDYLEKHTKNIQEFKARKGRHSYNDYMKGNVRWDKFCDSLCHFYIVSNVDRKMLAKKFEEGVGHFFKETQNSINLLHSLGIKNGILSNALPILGHTASNVQNLDKKCVFTSYELGLLKPDIKIFQKLAENLGACPNEIIFVDDKEKNVQAAKSIGINGIVYNKNTIESNIKDILEANQIVLKKEMLDRHIITRTKE